MAFDLNKLKALGDQLANKVQGAVGDKVDVQNIVKKAKSTVDKIATPKTAQTIEGKKQEISNKQAEIAKIQQQIHELEQDIIQAQAEQQVNTQTPPKEPDHEAPKVDNKAVPDQSQSSSTAGSQSDAQTTDHAPNRPPEESGEHEPMPSHEEKPGTKESESGVDDEEAKK